MLIRMPESSPPEAISDSFASPESLPPARRFPRARKFGKRLLIGTGVTIGYTISIGAYNAVQYYDLFENQGGRDDIDMIEDAEHCAPFDYVETEPQTGLPIAPAGFTFEQAKNTIAVEKQHAHVRSAAERLKPAGFNLLRFVEQFARANLHEFDSFTSAYSGAEIHLHSNIRNPSVEADTALLDELFHSTLDERITYDHITVGQFMECARENILLSRGGDMLKGVRINLYIHGTPGVCFSNGHLQEYPTTGNVTYLSFCDSSAGTLKDLWIDIVPGILTYEQTWSAVTTHHHDIDKANRSINRFILHEPAHLWMQSLGLPFKVHPNERLADHIEQQVTRQLYPKGIPLAVTYSES